MRQRVDLSGKRIRDILFLFVKKKTKKYLFYITSSHCPSSHLTPVGLCVPLDRSSRLFDTSVADL